MRKITLLLSVLTWIVLFGCGGGGGGGGTSDTGTTIIYSSDYTNRDITKVYTFKETVVDTTDGKNTSSENTISYRYDQNVLTIPSKYGYSGTISGPYTLETMELNGTDKGFTYYGSSHSIITDDSTVFTNMDHSDSTGVIPPDWTVGTVYTESAIEDLFNSTSGSKVGTRTIEHTLKALGVENVTVPAGTFKAAKTQESTTRTITVGSATETITTTSFYWYSKDVMVVKIVANTTDVFDDGLSSPETSTYTVTDELTNVSP
jgi:hypothetical protein